MPTQVADATAERLLDYGNISFPVIEQVSEFAGWQSTFETYEDFLEACGVDWLYRVKKDNFVFDHEPKEYNRNEALVVELPHANPLDPNQLFGLATIVGTNPNKRVISFANPSGRGYTAGELTSFERHQLQHGVLRGFGNARAYYLDAMGVNHVEAYGYSGGVEKVFALAAYGGHAVSSAVLLEPASVMPRSLANLGLQFARSNSEMPSYVEATGLKIFDDARRDAVGRAAYAAGLVRSTNVAGAKQMALGEFELNLQTALVHQNELAVALAWGSESRLATDAVMLAIAETTQSAFGPARLNAMRFDGESHAMANDLHLQAAIVLEGLRRARSFSSQEG